MEHQPKVVPVNARYWDLVEQLDSTDVEVSKWESDFLDSLLHKGSGFLSDKQKEVIDKMAERYLD